MAGTTVVSDTDHMVEELVISAIGMANGSIPFD